MRMLWKYLKPHRTLIFLSLLLAAGAQLLNLLDPVIFGKIIDDYATNNNNLPEYALIRGVIYWLLIALGIALLAKLFKAGQEYITRMGQPAFCESCRHGGRDQRVVTKSGCIRSGGKGFSRIGYSSRRKR